MSLTSRLRTKTDPIRMFLHERFPNTKPLIAEIVSIAKGAETIRPEVDVPWSLLGHAIDYRIRAYFAPVSMEGLPESAVQLIWPKSGWDMRMCAGFDLDERAIEIKSVGTRLGNEDEEWLARYCLFLGMLEHCARSRDIHPALLTLNPDTATAGDVLSISEQAWVNDLCNMSWGFYDNFNKLLTQKAILNPLFAGSKDIGGADGDLILDNCLLEIKATIHPERPSPDWLYQLLGYVLLDYDDFYNLDSVGIYLARQSKLVQWRLNEFLNAMSEDKCSGLAELRAEFKQLIISSPELG
ncbi:MAG: hypothetical protein ACR2OU_05190 [Thermomicrobiales bacterium]